MIISDILISQIKDNVVYRLHNKINNKDYIGSTKNLTVRMRQHKRGTHSWQKEFKEHPENFELELLERNVPENELYERELFYIMKYDSKNKGYNCCLNVSRIKPENKEINSIAHKQTDESISKIKNKVHEYYNDPKTLAEHGRKTSEAMKKLNQKWINNGIERHKVPYNDLQEWLDKGYKLGKGNI